MRMGGQEVIYIAQAMLLPELSHGIVVVDILLATTDTGTANENGNGNSACESS